MVEGISNTVIRGLQLEPSYREPSHSGQPAYAPVDPPTLSSSGLAVPLQARHWLQTLIMPPKLSRSAPHFSNSCPLLCGMRYRHRRSGAFGILMP
jgi:hypothetical protein